MRQRYVLKLTEAEGVLLWQLLRGALESTENEQHARCWRRLLTRLERELPPAKAVADRDDS
jgi:hypothetical protein